MDDVDDIVLFRDDLIDTAHAREVIRQHPWRVRRSARWRWWTPWRLETICRRCVMSYPCPTQRRPHGVLARSR